MIPQQHKCAVIRQLRNNKEVVEKVRESLANIPEAGEARKELLDAEFSILNSMHKISWIGEEHKEKEHKEKEHEEKPDNGNKLLQDKT